MEPFSSNSNLSGQLLVAHPGLQDPNFRKRVVLLSSHSEEDGALGVIFNWPLDQNLGEFDPAMAFDPLGKAPLYRGGPVADDQLIFAAWKWTEAEGIFRLAFGIDPEQARALMGQPGYDVRAFLGYAGWGKGQLEAEMAHHSWIVANIDGRMLAAESGPALWREILRGVSPEMKLWVDFPEDPSLN